MDYDLKMNSLFEKTKPKEALLRYDKAFSAFLSNFMAGNPEMVEVHCPFCEGEAFSEAFLLENCRYLRCKTCESLYNSPRLSKKELNNFYSKLSKWLNKPVSNIFLTEGLDGAVQCAFRSYTKENVSNIIVPDPSFAMYKVYAKIYNVKFII